MSVRKVSEGTRAIDNHPTPLVVAPGVDHGAGFDRPAELLHIVSNVRAGHQNGRIRGVADFVLGKSKSAIKWPQG